MPRRSSADRSLDARQETSPGLAASVAAWARRCSSPDRLAARLLAPRPAGATAFALARAARLRADLPAPRFTKLLRRYPQRPIISVMFGSGVPKSPGIPGFSVPGPAAAGPRSVVRVGRYRSRPSWARLGCRWRGCFGGMLRSFGCRPLPCCGLPGGWLGRRRVQRCSSRGQAARVVHRSRCSSPPRSVVQFVVRGQTPPWGCFSASGRRAMPSVRLCGLWLATV